MPGAHIAVIDDDAVFLDLLSELLGAEGDRVTLRHGGPVVHPCAGRLLYLARILGSLGR